MIKTWERFWKILDTGNGNEDCGKEETQDTDTDTDTRGMTDG